MAQVVFIGAYAYAREVLRHLPEDPALVITTSYDAPRQQHIEQDEHDGVHVALTYDGPDIGPLIHSFHPDLVVVAGWRRLVPIVAPTVGFHSAKLPEYPGRAPVANAILRGDTSLTNTMLYLDEGIDTGDVIDYVTFPITDDPDAIYKVIGWTSADMLQKHWQDLLNGTAPRHPQDMSKRGPETPADAWHQLDLQRQADGFG